MPFWDLIPAIKDGDFLSTDDGAILTTDGGEWLIYAAGWMPIAAVEDDAFTVA